MVGPILVLATLTAAGNPYNFDFRAQAQAGVQVSMHDGGTPGGVELHGAASLMGVGATMRLGYEELGEQRGAFYAIGIQMRPLTWLDKETFKTVDLHTTIGGLAGGLGGPEGAQFRGAVWLGAGLDFGLTKGDKQALLTIEYRYQPAQEPTGAPSHYLLVGPGLRRQ